MSRVSKACRNSHTAELLPHVTPSPGLRHACDLGSARLEGLYRLSLARRRLWAQQRFGRHGGVRFPSASQAAQRGRMQAQMCERHAMGRPLLLSFLLVTTAAVEASAGATPSLSAVFDSAGIRGTLDVETPTAGAGFSVRASLLGGQPKETFRWAVHRLPPRHDSSTPCAYEWIGEQLQDLTGEFGQLASEQDTNVASKTSLPVEPRHWAGRALVLRSPQTGRLACAALQPPGAPVTTYAARFQGPPVAGTLFLRLWPTFASVYAELHWTNGTRRDAQLRWSVRKIGQQPGTLLQQPAHDSESMAGNPPSGNLEHVTPPNVPPVPQPPENKPPVVKPCYTPPDSCSHVTVGKRPGTLGTRTYHVIEGAVPPLRDCGTDEQLEVSLVDVSTGEPLAAGALLVWSPRHAVASLGPRHGKAIFHQTSPFEPTLAVVKLESLDYVASQLLITPISIGSADTLCPGPSAPYNPAKVDRAASPPEGFGSDDQFPVGDLSGKYGPLSGLRSFHRHLLDATLPLSGPESIVGRMLLVRGTDGRPLVCANVLPVFNGELIRARSTFTGPLRGSITITRAKQGLPIIPHSAAPLLIIVFASKCLSCILLLPQQLVILFMHWTAFLTLHIFAMCCVGLHNLFNKVLQMFTQGW
ncbi:hypothetical protein HPB48_022590 [Haemaphysalis longicornis]|uniref:Uncharacterized protein n=1 Tax=Haemaphysalis longicornis TaxID=44386 RepID=A0A9J6G6V9_HAELO|nr:hypothetical protein HPB48_022590 [Haemaphysalis longicornis]